MERRKETRYPTLRTAVVSAPGSGEGSRDFAQIVDISESGMRLTLDRAILPGASVVIRLKAVALVIVGRIRYCERLASQSFTMGLEIIEVLGAERSKRLSPEEVWEVVGTHEVAP
jgi:hypothetical protein